MSQINIWELVMQLYGSKANMYTHKNHEKFTRIPESVVLSPVEPTSQLEMFLITNLSLLIAMAIVRSKMEILRLSLNNKPQ